MLSNEILDMTVAQNTYSRVNWCIFDKQPRSLRARQALKVGFDSQLEEMGEKGGLCRLDLSCRPGNGGKNPNHGLGNGHHPR